MTIFWYGDATFVNGAQARLKELVDLGALPVTHGWTHPYVDDLVYPQVLEPPSKDQPATTWAVSVETGLGSEAVSCPLAIVWPCPLPVDAYVTAGSDVEVPCPVCAVTLPW